MTTAEHNTLMGLLTAALLPGEKARFEVAVASNGDVIATVLPVRQAVEHSDETPEAARELMAALAMPIQERASAAEIESQLVATLSGYQRQRHAINDTLEALNEALAAGRAAAHEARPGAGETSKPESKQVPAGKDAASAPAQPVPEYGNDNPDAL